MVSYGVERERKHEAFEVLVCVVGTSSCHQEDEHSYIYAG